MPPLDHSWPIFVAARQPKIIALVVIATMLVATRPANAETAPETTVVHDGPSAPAQAWRTAMEAGDLAALARMHDAATIGYPPDTLKVAGADAIMTDYARLFATYTVRVSVEDTHWVAQGPLVVSWGLFTLTLHPKAGGLDRVTHGRFTDAAVRSGDGWRYLIDHASMPKP